MLSPPPDELLGFEAFEEVRCFLCLGALVEEELLTLAVRVRREEADEERREAEVRRVALPAAAMESASA